MQQLCPRRWLRRRPGWAERLSPQRERLSSARRSSRRGGLAVLSAAEAKERQRAIGEGCGGERIRAVGCSRSQEVNTTAPRVRSLVVTTRSSKAIFARSRSREAQPKRACLLHSSLTVRLPLLHCAVADTPHLEQRRQPRSTARERLAIARLPCALAHGSHTSSAQRGPFDLLPAASSCSAR